MRCSRAVVAFCCLFPAVALAQAWPAKSVRVVSSSASSSPGDVSMRLVAAKLTTTLGQPVVIETRQIQKVAKEAEVTSKLDEIDITLVASSPQQLAETIRRQEAIVAELVKRGGL